jgi:hypothetical protein
MSATYSQEDADRIMETLGKFAPALNTMLREQEKRSRADEKAGKESRDRLLEFDSKISHANRSIQGFTGGLDGAVKHFTKTLLSPLGSKAFIGIAALGALWTAGAKLNETWREMTEIGQTFGGSMGIMQAAAASAGLPLETFAKLQKAHNVTINAVGKNYWQVNKQLRENIHAAGMYGMSMEQLGDFTANYMEVFRRNGSLQNRSIGSVVNDMNDLALSTTALAKESDKTREEITKLATSAMSSALGFAGLNSIPNAIKASATKSIAEATAAFAALPGTAGEYFAKFFTDSLGVGSSLTDGGQLAVEAGLSGLASQMDAVALKFKAGQGTMADELAMRNNFIDSVDNNMQQLTALAASGNAAAKQMIEMRAPLKKQSMAEYERAKTEAKTAKAFTALFASLESIWTTIKSSFGKGFLDAFNRTFKGFDDFTKSPVFSSMIKFMEVMGERLGTFLGSFLTNLDANKLATNMQNIASGVVDLATGVLGAKPIWDMMINFIWAVTAPMRGLISAFSQLSESSQKLVGMFIGGALLLGKVKSLFGGMFKSNMNVNANVVNVNGGEGGGGIDGAGGKGKGGRMGRIGKLMRRGFRGGGVGGAARMGLSGIRGIGLKGLGGAAMRLGTGLGIGALGMGAEYGGSKLQENGYGKTGAALGIGGRMLGYGATGAALGSFIPGIGTVAGGALGAAYGGISGYMDYGSKAAAPAKAAEASGKAAAATTAAAASIAATSEAMRNQQTLADDTEAKPVVDPMQTLIDEIKGLRQDVRRGNAVMVGKQDAALRVLGKIEVSAQSL